MLQDYAVRQPLCAVKAKAPEVCCKNGNTGRSASAKTLDNNPIKKQENRVCTKICTTPTNGFVKGDNCNLKNKEYCLKASG